MLRSLYAGVSGLKAHQMRMDIIGNNISNVNTVGYKKSSITFKDALYQTLKGAGTPKNGNGGTNAQQVGLGVAVGSIDTIHTQGSTQLTGGTLDLTIQGSGFFVVRSGETREYTRAGNFDVDGDGNMYSKSTGLIVQGWIADKTGNVDTSQAISDIKFQTEQMPPNASSVVYFGNNLNSEAILNNRDLVLDPTSTTPTNVNITFTKNSDSTWTWTTTSGGTADGGTGQIEFNEDGSLKNITNGTASTYDATKLTSLKDALSNLSDKKIKPDSFVAPVDAYDSLGVKHELKVTYIRTGADTWKWSANLEGFTNDDYSATSPNPGTGEILGNSGTVTFNTDGSLKNMTYDQVTGTSGDTITPTALKFGPGGGADPVNITLDFTKISQYASSTTVAFQKQDGYGMGKLQGMTVDSLGRVTGTYSNGLTKTLAQVAIANFTNPSGLVKKGNNLFEESNNSGVAQVGTAEDRVEIVSGALEMSNVDLSQEFTDMIVTQRGFQANTKIITASDEILQDLIGLKR